MLLDAPSFTAARDFDPRLGEEADMGVDRQLPWTVADKELSSAKDHVIRYKIYKDHEISQLISH